MTSNYYDLYDSNGTDIGTLYILKDNKNVYHNFYRVPFTSVWEPSGEYCEFHLKSELKEKYYLNNPEPKYNGESINMINLYYFTTDYFVLDENGSFEIYGDTIASYKYVDLSKYEKK